MVENKVKSLTMNAEGHFRFGVTGQYSKITLTDLKKAYDDYQEGKGSYKRLGLLYGINPRGLYRYFKKIERGDFKPYI